MCGRRLPGKNFLTIRIRSVAVVCPACQRGTYGRWP